MSYLNQRGGDSEGVRKATGHYSVCASSAALCVLTAACQPAEPEPPGGGVC